MGERGTHRTELTRRSRLDYLMKKNVNFIRKPLPVPKSADIIISEGILNKRSDKTQLKLNSLNNNNNNKNIDVGRSNRKLKIRNNLRLISNNIHRKIRFGLLEKDCNSKNIKYTKDLSDIKENLFNKNEKSIIQKHKGIKSNAKPKILSRSTSFNPATVTD